MSAGSRWCLRVSVNFVIRESTRWGDYKCEPRESSREERAENDEPRPALRNLTDGRAARGRFPYQLAVFGSQFSARSSRLALLGSLFSARYCSAALIAV